MIVNNEIESIRQMTLKCKEMSDEFNKICRLTIDCTNLINGLKSMSLEDQRATQEAFNYMTAVIMVTKQTVDEIAAKGDAALAEYKNLEDSFYTSLLKGIIDIIEGDNEDGE